MRKKETVHLRLSGVKIVGVEPFWIDEETNPDVEPVDATLKDFAILFDRACGQGVEWSLAYELSERLNVSYGKVCVELSEVFRKYRTMKDLEAYDNCYVDGHPSGYEATCEYLDTLPEEEIPSAFKTTLAIYNTHRIEREIKEDAEPFSL